MIIKSTHEVQLKGEVIEILDKDGFATAKITLSDSMIEIPVQRKDFVHLGDRLKIKGTILIEEVIQDILSSDKEQSFS